MRARENRRRFEGAYVGRSDEYVLARMERSGMHDKSRSVGRRLDCLVKASLLDCTALPYCIGAMPMDSTTVNKFRDSLKTFVEQVVSKHTPLRVTRRNGSDFVVMSAEDWERDQETLYVLQNSSLMRQIAESSATHAARTGYTPTKDQLDEILGV